MNQRNLVQYFIKKAIGEFALPGSGAPWLKDVEEKVGLRFPPAYAELLRRFTFPVFSINGITFFGNTENCADNDLKVQLFRDKYIYEPAFRHGFLQFGRPDTSSYDPICFNASEKGHYGEIVQLDHECLLIKEKAVIVNGIARSFLEFMEKCVSDENIIGKIALD